MAAEPVTPAGSDQYGPADRERFVLQPTSSPRDDFERDLEALLKATYTGPIGAEYMHIADVEQRRWMQDRLETAAGDYGMDTDAK